MTSFPNHIQFINESSVHQVTNLKPSARPHLIGIDGDADVSSALETLKKFDCIALPIIKPKSHLHHNNITTLNNNDEPTSNTNTQPHDHPNQTSGSHNHSESHASLIEKGLHSRIIGILNLFQLCEPIINHKIFDQLLHDKADITEWQNIDNADLPEFHTRLTTLLNNKKEPKSLIDECPYVSSNSQVSLLFSLFSKGIHRCLVDREKIKDNLSPQDHPDTVAEVDFISQSDMIRWIHNHQDKFGAVLDLSLQELGLVLSDSTPLTISNEYNSNVQSVPIQGKINNQTTTRQVVTVNENTTTLIAFRELFNISKGIEHMAAPVVNAAGKYSGTVSIADLRFISPSHLHLLSFPISQFITEIWSKRTHVKQNNTCTPQTKLRDVIQMCTDDAFHLSQHGHAVWVLNSENVVVAAVTLTDIMRTLSKH